MHVEVSCAFGGLGPELPNDFDDWFDPQWIHLNGVESFSGSRHPVGDLTGSGEMEDLGDVTRRRFQTRANEDSGPVFCEIVALEIAKASMEVGENLSRRRIDRSRHNFVSPDPMDVLIQNIAEVESRDDPEKKVQCSARS